MGLEKKIEQKLIDEVKKRDGLALKFVSPGMDGMPDRLVLIAVGKIGARFARVQAKFLTSSMCISMTMTFQRYHSILQYPML